MIIFLTYQMFIIPKKLDLKQIQDDLNEAKKKFKEVLKKYKGKVVFGIAGEHADW